LIFFDHHCVHPLKKTPPHKHEFLLVFLTGLPRRCSWTFADTSRELCFFSSPTLGFGSIDVWGLFFWGVEVMFEKPPPKKSQAKTDLNEVTTEPFWWGYSHPNGLSSLLKLGKNLHRDCLRFQISVRFFQPDSSKCSLFSFHGFFNCCLEKCSDQETSADLAWRNWTNYDVGASPSKHDMPPSKLVIFCKMDRWIRYDRIGYDRIG